MKIKDVCSINLNSYSAKNDNWDFVNYLDTSNITANAIEFIQRIDISKEKLPSRAKRKVKLDSIIFSTVRPIQCHYGIIKSLPENFLVSTGFAVIDVNPEKVDANFLYYYLTQNKIVQHLQSVAEQSTTAYPSITPSDLANLEIDLPPIETQRKIGNVLYTIDQKIEVNKKINATLEAMAKLIYEYYFFKRPANATIGDIIIENKKSSIPVGNAKNIKGDYPFFTSGDSVLQWTKALVDGRNIFLHTGGNSGVKFFVGKAAYSTDTWCITAKNNLADYLYLFLKTIQVEIDKKFFAGTALKHLQKDLLKMREIYIPTESELEKLNAEIQPGFTMIAKNLMENRKLAEYRDFLLPLFMNGQISFK